MKIRIFNKELVSPFVFKNEIVPLNAFFSYTLDTQILAYPVINMDNKIPGFYVNKGIYRLFSSLYNAFFQFPDRNCGGAPLRGSAVLML